MPIPLPELDDREFDELFEEARALIPRYNREWTNYNPSDPGITMLELFAWLCEQTLYRMDRIPIQRYETFLKIVGITLEPGESIESGIARAQTFIRERFRAVTSEDYRVIAQERMNELEPGMGEGRVIVLNNVDLEFVTGELTSLDQVRKPGHVSVMVIPKCDPGSMWCEEGDNLLFPSQALLDVLAGEGKV